MMVLARGLAKFASGGMKVSTAILNADGTYRYAEVPPLFRFVDHRVLGGNISVVTLIFLACAAVAWVLMSRHIWGRYLYAIGGNEAASRFSGVPVVAAKTLAYAFSGMCAAVAGICQAAQEQQGDPEAGTGYELIAIAMVVIGGTSLMGGRGGIGLTLLGVLTIGYLDKILSINAVPEAGRLVLTGIIIVAAVLTQRRKANLKFKNICSTKHYNPNCRCNLAIICCNGLSPVAKNPARPPQPNSPAPQKQFTIGMSQCNLGEPWRVQMNADIAAAAAKHPELKVIFKDAQNDTLQQRAQIEEFVSAKVDLLIISPKEAQPLTEPVARAMDAGIPVIVLDRRLLGDQLHLLHRRG